MGNWNTAAAPSPFPQRFSPPTCPTLPTAPSPCSFPLNHIWLHGFTKRTKALTLSSGFPLCSTGWGSPFPWETPTKWTPKGWLWAPCGAASRPAPFPPRRGRKDSALEPKDIPRSAQSAIPSGAAFPGLTLPWRSRDRSSRLSAHPAPQSSILGAGRWGQGQARLHSYDRPFSHHCWALTGWQGPGTRSRTRRSRSRTRSSGAAAALPPPPPAPRAQPGAPAGRHFRVLLCTAHVTPGRGVGGAEKAPPPSLPRRKWAGAP